MNYLLLGLSHKTAPVQLRELVSLDVTKSEFFLKSAKNLPGVNEVLVVSTCNRVEIYAVSDQPDETAKHLLRELVGEQSGLDMQNCFYQYVGDAAVRHLFSVTSSLDSQVVGENQITAQVKEAFEHAMRMGTTGTFLNKLFSHALYVSKKVRTETEISRGQVSMSSAAVSLARKIFGSLANRKVLLIGAGEMGELCVRALRSGEVGEVNIVNRTEEKARELAAQGLGLAFPYQDLPKLLATADVVITSVSASLPELSAENLADLMKSRGQEPLFIIDLGMPRNVPEASGKIDDVYLYNLDDLKIITDQGREIRDGEATRARAMIQDEVEAFFSVAPARVPAEISRLAEKFENMRQREFAKTLTRLAHLSEQDIKQIEKLSVSLVEKILQDPIITLRRDAEEEPTLREVARRLFRLDDDG